MRFYLMFIYIVTACGTEFNAEEIQYELEFVARAIPQNKLILSSTNLNPPSFSLSGVGYSADIPLDTINPFVENINIEVDQIGVNQITLTFFNQDQTPFIKDTLEWEYGTEVPPDPIIGFSEFASNDEDVTILIPPSKGRNTNEIWIEGDLQNSDGQWYTIPLSGQIPIKLSENEELKNITVRYRNIFQLESENVSFSIQRKETPPQNCAVQIKSTTLNTKYGTVKIFADDPFPLRYKISGDIKVAYDFQSFETGDTIPLEFLNEIGINDVAVTIQDIAGNECDPIELRLLVDPNYSESEIMFEGDAFYTNSPRITVYPRFDSLNDVTMKISGNILPSSNTFVKIPFQDSLDVILSPVQGTRHVLVEFYNGDELVGQNSNHIYLLPTPTVLGSNPNFRIVANKIIELESVTITGCTQIYNKVSYSTEYPCTKSAANLNITYKFLDQTTLVQQIPF